MQNMADGFSAACRELGAEALCMGPDSYTAQAQHRHHRRAVDRKVDAIVIAANDSDELQDALQRAMDEGIAVLSLDSAVNRESRMLHIQQADPEKIGRVLHPGRLQDGGRRGQGGGPVGHAAGHQPEPVDRMDAAGDRAESVGLREV